MEDGRNRHLGEAELTEGVTRRLKKASAMLADLKAAGPWGISDEAVIRNYACLIQDLIDDAGKLHRELWQRVQPNLVREQLGRSATERRALPD
jgi:hypothetical protein